MSKTKVNYTEEDEEIYLTNLFIQMIVKDKHPNIIKKAQKLAKKFLKENKCSFFHEKENKNRHLFSVRKPLIFASTIN